MPAITIVSDCCRHGIIAEGLPVSDARITVGIILPGEDDG